jgi:hypothetical protein
MKLTPFKPTSRQLPSARRGLTVLRPGLLTTIASAIVLVLAAA